MMERWKNGKHLALSKTPYPVHLLSYSRANGNPEPAKTIWISAFAGKTNPKTLQWVFLSKS
jgi:hypothetical protein